MEEQNEVFENTVLEIILLPKTGKLIRNELHNLYCSPDIIRLFKWRKREWGGACSTHERGMRNIDKTFSLKSSEEGPFSRHRRRWKDNIKTDHKERVRVN
jgi:hypothetical protein